jgi:hypothetical protein
MLLWLHMQKSVLPYAVNSINKRSAIFVTLLAHDCYRLRIIFSQQALKTSTSGVQLWRLSGVLISL